MNAAGFSRRLPLTTPTVIVFRGPDAERYLNGQLTQDVRRVVDGARSLPSCVTDAKGRLQFRIWLHRSVAGDWWVSSDHAEPEALFARLTRYLIADDAEAEDATGSWRRLHLTGDLPDGVEYQAVAADRIGLPGWDVWIPSAVPEDSFGRLLALEEWPQAAVETQRITSGVPVWGAELAEGMLPPEAGLDRSDISYAKGCYIGQEVISRIKSAGKVNRKLLRLSLDSSVAVAAGEGLFDPLGGEAGHLTSVAPFADGSVRHALGYVKRGAMAGELKLASGAAVHIAG